MSASPTEPDGRGEPAGSLLALSPHGYTRDDCAAPDPGCASKGRCVVFEDADCFGTPVIEAARLCAAAAGGQILVTDVVRLLAGTGGGCDFQAVGPLDLKGLPAPVSACEVAWEPLPLSSVPMPALLTDIGRIFVGRERELERLGQLWEVLVARNQPGNAERARELLGRALATARDLGLGTIERGAVVLLTGG